MRTSAEIREELLSSLVLAKTLDDVMAVGKNCSVLKNFGVLSFEDYTIVRKERSNRFKTIFNESYDDDE